MSMPSIFREIIRLRVTMSDISWTAADEERGQGQIIRVSPDEGNKIRVHITGIGP